MHLSIQHPSIYLSIQNIGIHWIKLFQSILKIIGSCAKDWVIYHCFLPLVHQTLHIDFKLLFVVACNLFRPLTAFTQLTECIQLVIRLFRSHLFNGVYSFGHTYSARSKKQASKQASKQANKQASKQASKQQRQDGFCRIFNCLNWCV